MESAVDQVPTVTIKQIEGKLATLTAINSALQSENEQLRFQLEEAQAPKTDAEYELQELQEEFTRRMHQLESTVSILKEEREKLKQQLASANVGEAKLQEKEFAIKNLREQIEKLTRKCGELEGVQKKMKNQTKEVELERDRLQAKVKNLEIKVHESGTQVEIANQYASTQVHQLEEDLRTLKADMHEKAKLLQLSQEESETLRLKFEEKVNALQSSEERELVLQNTVESLQQQLSEKLEELDERDNAQRLKDIQHLEQIRTMQNEMEEIRTMGTQSTKPLFKQIESLTQQLAQQQQTAKEVEQKLLGKTKELEQEVLQTSRQEQEALGRVRTLQAALQVAQDQVTKLTEKVAQLTLQLDNESQKASLTTAQNQTLQSKCAQLTEELDNSNRANKSLEQRISQLQVSLSVLQEQVSNQDHPKKTVSTQTLQYPTPKEEKTTALSENGQRSSQNDNWAVGDLVTETSPPRQHLNGVENELVAKLKRQLRSSESSREQALQSLQQVADDLRQTQEEIEGAKKVRQQYQDLTRKYDMLLELLGERNERVEQLEEDIVDMKRIFHEQLQLAMDQVVGKVDR